MSTKAVLTETTELVVESNFLGCSGLTVGQLRAFVEGANTAELDDDTRVELDVVPQSDPRVVDVYLTASKAETTSKGLKQVPEEPLPEETVA